jgi:hypothetical protein
MCGQVQTTGMSDSLQTAGSLASDSPTRTLGQLAITPSETTVTEAAKANKTKCSLYKLHPEIRRQIFILSAHHFLEVERDLRPGLGRDMHELRYPDLVFDWDPLLYPEAYQGHKSPKGLSNLELVFYGRENELYFESFQARLSFSKLVFVPPQAETHDKVSYPSFGNELPYWVLDSVRHLRYELE